MWGVGTYFAEKAVYSNDYWYGVWAYIERGKMGKREGA
jgi:hypothetical protein